MLPAFRGYFVMAAAREIRLLRCARGRDLIIRTNENEIVYANPRLQLVSDIDRVRDGRNASGSFFRFAVKRTEGGLRILIYSSFVLRWP